jgi:hypothetical protein
VKITSALVCEQEVTFAVVVVTPASLAPHKRQGAQASLQPLFPATPVVLMAQDPTGKATFFGRQDITAFLSRVRIDQLPWKTWDPNMAQPAGAVTGKVTIGG